MEKPILGSNVDTTKREISAETIARIHELTPSLNDLQGKEQPTVEPKEQPKAEPTPVAPPAQIKTEEPVKAPEPPVKPEAQIEDDPSVNERTRKRIQKLLDENKKLRSAQHSVFDEVNPVEVGVGASPFVQPPQMFPSVPQAQAQYIPQPQPFMSQTQVQNLAQNLVNQDGYLDEAKLNNLISGYNQRAQQAEANAQAALKQAQQAHQKVEQQEQNQQVKEAHAQVPEIDPESVDFDEDIYNLVVDRLFKNKVQGKKQSLAEVASEVKQLFNKNQPDVKKVEESAAKAAVQDYEAKLEQAKTARDQMPIESGHGQDRTAVQQPAKTHSLRDKNRSLDDPDIQSRLKNYMSKPS